MLLRLVELGYFSEILASIVPPRNERFLLGVLVRLCYVATIGSSEAVDFSSWQFAESLVAKVFKV